MEDIERKYVHDTYQIIAQDFSVTRAYLWSSVKKFLGLIEPGSIITEIGSGNGKNLIERKDCINLAFDLCSKFCEISKGRGVDSVVANNIKVPLRSNSADYVMSIAVIHHLCTEKRRLQSICELVRILKPGGKLLIQVWALEQAKTARRQFSQADNFVEFQNSQKTVKEKRFYHVFQKGELESLVEQIPETEIIESCWERGNWVMVLQKTKKKVMTNKTKIQQGDTNTNSPKKKNKK